MTTQSSGKSGAVRLEVLTDSGAVCVDGVCAVPEGAYADAELSESTTTEGDIAGAAEVSRKPA